MSKNLTVEKIYILGNGTVALGMGKEANTDIPFISISKMDIEKPFKVGEDIIDKETNDKETILILFKTIQGLEALEYIIKKAKKALKENNKLNGI